MGQAHAGPETVDLLYTPEERRRRDASRWTLVQGILAPLQFVVFIVSAILVWRCLETGEGAFAAQLSVVLKTLVLYAIMVTGALWERDVFGRYLFARPFFWEDVVSMGVIWPAHRVPRRPRDWDGWICASTQMIVALVAYAAYVVNAAQFLWKFRLARQTRPAAAQPL